MAEIQTSESPHERRVTWSLMAAVVAFVLVMSCIVLWVTTSLIREERKGASPIGTLAPATPVSPTLTVQLLDPPTLIPTTRAEPTSGPSQIESTWTPVPGSRRYVRFVYWYVKPNKITVGECIQVTWKTEYAVDLQLYRNDELFVDHAPIATTVQDCPKKPGYVVYRLVGINSVGESNWIQLQVKVVAAP